MIEAFGTPRPGRLISYIHDDGMLYKMPIITFVTLMTYRALADRSLDTTPESVNQASGAVASALSRDGWFSRDEYIEALTEAETSTLDDDLDKLLQGGE